MISGGHALVEIVGAGAVPKVTLNGTDVSSQFALRPNGRVMGLVTGLDEGTNTLTAAGSSATITNHPNGGPSSPARTSQVPLPGQRGRRQCNQPAEYSYLYRSTDPTKADLLPYDPASPAVRRGDDDDGRGVKVPFIVRQELGYQDRDRYKILTLYTPGRTWTRWAPQQQWNHKLLVTGGGGCGVSTAGRPAAQRL